MHQTNPKINSAIANSLVVGITNYNSLTHILSKAFHVIKISLAINARMNDWLSNSPTANTHEILTRQQESGIVSCHEI